MCVSDEELRELAIRTKRGERDAFAELYRRTCDDVYRTTALLMGRENEAADITHEVYIQLLASLGRYDPARAFRPWLHGVAVRQVRLWRRRIWRRVRLADKLLSLPESGHDVARMRESGLRTHSEADALDLVDAVRALPLKFRETIVLRYYHDYSLPEIAATLNIPLGTVKSRLHTALRALRGQFQAPSHAEEESGPWASNKI